MAIVSIFRAFAPITSIRARDLCYLRDRAGTGCRQHLSDRPSSSRSVAASIRPVYLTLEDILGLHGLIIGATSIEAGDQLRDRYELESALADLRYRSRGPGGPVR